MHNTIGKHATLQLAIVAMSFIGDTIQAVEQEIHALPTDVISVLLCLLLMVLALVAG